MSRIPFRSFETEQIFFVGMRAPFKRLFALSSEMVGLNIY